MKRKHLTRPLFFCAFALSSAASASAAASKEPAGVTIARCGFSEPWADVILDFSKKTLVMRSESGTTQFSHVAIKYQRSGEIHISKQKGAKAIPLMEIDPHLKGSDSMSDHVYEAAAALEIKTEGQMGGCDFFVDRCSLETVGARCLIRKTDGSFDGGVCTKLKKSSGCVRE